MRAVSRLGFRNRIAMPRNRTILGWALIALYFSIAVLGEALHVLPGMGHGCAADHHGGEACHFRSAARVFSSDRPGVCVEGRDHEYSCADNCPICQYFAQAKYFLELEGILSESLPNCVRQIASPLPLDRQSLSAYQSRGPPAADCV
jgi:hypothetical protein